MILSTLSATTLSHRTAWLSCLKGCAFNASSLAQSAAFLTARPSILLYSTQFGSSLLKKMYCTPKHASLVDITADITDSCFVSIIFHPFLSSAEMVICYREVRAEGGNHFFDSTRAVCPHFGQMRISYFGLSSPIVHHCLHFPH